MKATELIAKCLENEGVEPYDGWSSPAEKLNKRRYHDCWLENLLISASLRGRRGAPPNP